MFKVALSISVALFTTLFVAPHTANAQDKPTVPTTALPAKAPCYICSLNGEAHGDEKPAGALAYKGKTYYFCSKKERDAFAKDPDAFIPLPVPRNAPAFTLKDSSGASVTLESLSGKVLLVDFWATWCVPCVKAMPTMQRLQDQYAAKGFSVVGISIDEEGARKVAPFLAKSKTRFTYPILLDTDPGNAAVWQQWGVKSVPAVMLVKNGQIVQQWSGKIDPKELEKAVGDALKN